MHLIIQYFNDKNKERKEEYDKCLNKNLNNPVVSKIHTINEKETIMDIDHPKLIKVPFDYNKDYSVPGRLTFKYALEYINENIPPNEVVGILNLDIYISEEKEEINEWINIYENFFNINPDDKKVLFVSRYEDVISEKFMAGAQLEGTSCDSWFFKTPVPVPSNSDFCIGNAPYCDGGFGRLIYDCGYKIFNWPGKYCVYHLDNARGHHYDGTNLVLTSKTDETVGKKCNNKFITIPPFPCIIWNEYLYNKENNFIYITRGNYKYLTVIKK